MRHRRAPSFFLLLAAAVLTAGSALAQPVPEDRGRNQNQKSEWELEQEKRNWKEGDVKLPAYPKAEGMIEFFVSGATSFRFFIDPESVAPGPDSVVRYTLIARSPSGVSNVSYEGIRCDTNSFRVYALGNDGRWSARESEWRAIEPRSVQRWHLELRTQYFCPGRIAIHTAAEGVDALRRGGHPAASIKTGSER